MGQPAKTYNVRYLVIGALVITTAVFGHQPYQERQNATSIAIGVGQRGISIEKQSFGISRIAPSMVRHLENGNQGFAV